MDELQEIRDLVRRLELPAQGDEVEDSAGKRRPAVVVRHGDWHLLLIPAPQSVMVTLTLDVEPALSERLDKLPPEGRDRFLTMLRRELLEGRTGFKIHWAQPAPPQGLRAIVVEQRIVLQFPGVEQRLLDAIQEIVVLAVRVGQVFAVTFRGVEEKPRPDQSGHDAMFH